MWKRFERQNELPLTTSVPELEPEAGIWYAMCFLVVAARYASRRLRLGAWNRLQTDDYLMILPLITLTALFGVMHTIVDLKNSMRGPGDDIANWTPEEIEKRIYSLKLTVVAEQMQVFTIFALKACILTVYSRMTDITTSRWFVKGTAIYVAVSFIVMEILWFGVWCRPFNHYWAFPSTNAQCSGMDNHLITNSALNVSSDILILIIPLPLVWKVKIPLLNKLILGGLLSLGLFTIAAATMNKLESYLHPYSGNWMVWYLREAFTATLCANLPLTRPLLQHFVKLKTWNTRSSVTHMDNSSRTPDGMIRLRSSISVVSNPYGSGLPETPIEERAGERRASFETTYEMDSRGRVHAFHQKDIEAGYGIHNERR